MTMKVLLKCLVYTFLTFMSAPVWAQNNPAQATPSVQEILMRMMERNQWQARALLEFRAHRKFYAANARFKTDSTMYVQTTFRHPDQLESTVKIGRASCRERV